MAVAKMDSIRIEGLKQKGSGAGSLTALGRSLKLAEGVTVTVNGGAFSVAAIKDIEEACGILLANGKRSDKQFVNHYVAVQNADGSVSSVRPMLVLEKPKDGFPSIGNIEQCFSIVGTTFSTEAKLNELDTAKNTVKLNFDTLSKMDANGSDIEVKLAWTKTTINKEEVEFFDVIGVRYRSTNTGEWIVLKGTVAVFEAA